MLVAIPTAIPEEPLAEEVGKFGWENSRLCFGLIIVRDHIDCVFIEIFHEGHRGMRQTRFGITHRSWRVAVDRSEVSLSIDKAVAHRPILRHADEGRIDHRFTVRMVVARSIAADLGAFTVFAAGAKLSWRIA